MEDSEYAGPDWTAEAERTRKIIGGGTGSSRIRPGLTDTYRVQQSDGLHLPEHEYRLALYGPAARLGPEAIAYTPAGEVQGLGYVSGGYVLSDRRVTLVNGVAVTEWATLEIDPATIDAVGALIFNASLPGMPSVAVILFGEPTSSTNGPFRVPLAQVIQWGR